MQKVISYGLRDLALDMFRADEDGADLVQLAYEDAQSSIERDYKGLYSALVCGSIDSFHYKKGANIYFYTRSLYPGVEVQKTCFWDRGGELVPLSHVDLRAFSDLVADGLADEVTITAA